MTFEIKNGFLKVETHKSGHFIFQIGLDLGQLNFLMVQSTIKL